MTLPIYLDITERKRVENALRESEQEYRSLVQSIQVGVVVHAPDSSVLFSNPRASQLLGLTPDQMRGKTAIDEAWRFIREDETRMPPEEYPVNQVLATHKPITNLILGILRPDRAGPTWVQCNAYQDWDLDGNLQQIVASFADFTERKQAEEELARRTQELTRSNAELEHFAHVASHDLQEPLRMVSSFMGLLAQRYRGQLDADADEFIGFAIDGAQRMQRLINGLLDYSRVGTRGRPRQPTDAMAALDDALWNLNLAIQDAGATVTRDPLPTVMADRDQLAQVFQNLIGNGIKFRGAEPPRVHISASETFEVSETSKVLGTKVWQFSVRDNGIGIAAGDIGRIFGIFQRLHAQAEYPGTGIGLATCKKIIERHGGRIWVESEVGQGTTFYFTIPVAA